MKYLHLVAVAGLLVLLSSAHAMALSIEQRDTVNSDGTSKFADPDEQTPPMLAAPDTSGQSRGYSVGPSVNGPSVPQMMGAGREGEQSFDHAYSHLQNQDR